LRGPVLCELWPYCSRWTSAILPASRRGCLCGAFVASWVPCTCLPSPWRMPSCRQSTASARRTTTRSRSSKRTSGRGRTFAFCGQNRAFAVIDNGLPDCCCEQSRTAEKPCKTLVWRPSSSLPTRPGYGIAEASPILAKHPPSIFLLCNVVWRSGRQACQHAACPDIASGSGELRGASVPTQATLRPGATAIRTSSLKNVIRAVGGMQTLYPMLAQVRRCRPYNGVVRYLNGHVGSLCVHHICSSARRSHRPTRKM